MTITKNGNSVFLAKRNAVMGTTEYFSLSSKRTVHFRCAIRNVILDVDARRAMPETTMDTVWMKTSDVCSKSNCQIKVHRCDNRTIIETPPPFIRMFLFLL